MKALKDLMDGLGVKNIDCRQDGAKIDPTQRGGYLFNSGIAGIEEADALLIIGSNPRFEAPLVNTRIRKTWLWGDLEIGLIGQADDLTYPYEHIGTNPASIADVLKSDKGFARKFKAANKPMIIIGQGALSRKDGAKILRQCADLASKTNVISDDWNGFNVLHTAASRVAGLDMGFVPGEGGLAAKDIGASDVETVFLLGADEMDMTGLTDKFVIYQGSHGDAGAHVADVILPGAAYTEKDGLYVNTEGRVQMAVPAVPAKGDAKEDWAIIRALSALAGQTLPYDSLAQLREKLFADHPSFTSLDHVATETDFDLTKLGESGNPDSSPFINPITDFYMTNPIARASKVMAECSQLVEDDGMSEAAE
jgi:NADH-quinone oxidoreductase subunit G